jgi:hypothetical protein
MIIKFTMAQGFSINYICFMKVWQCSQGGIIRSDLAKKPTKLIGWNLNTGKIVKTFHKRIKF